MKTKNTSKAAKVAGSQKTIVGKPIKEDHAIREPGLRLETPATSATSSPATPSSNDPKTQAASRKTKVRMLMSGSAMCTLFAVAVLCPVLSAQQPMPSQAIVPRLVNFSGKAMDAQGKAIVGIAGATFAIYKDQYDGSPLWLETQNVTTDAKGNYTAQLGATKPEGLPLDLFSSAEARWLGVQINGGEEQPRVLLLSVPYALKAADAETIGGLPASAFVLANKNSGVSTETKAEAPASTATTKNVAPAANPAVTGKGVLDFIPMWDTTSDIIDSLIFQKSSKVGINTTAPAALLDVNGKGDVRDTLTLFPKGTDSTLAVSGTTFKIDQTGNVTFISGQTFPGAGTITGITTASGSGLSGGGTSGTLSLKVPSAGITNAMLQSPTITLNGSTAGGLTAPGGMTLGATSTIGLKTCAANQILQYSGSVWNCSSAGTGTVTGVTTASGSGLAGGGTGGTLNLSVNSSIVPELAAANVFTNVNTINANDIAAAALTLANPAGDGIDVYGAGEYGGYFYADRGLYSTENSFSDFASGIAGGGTGAGMTVGVSGYGYGAITQNNGNFPVGIGVYGQGYTASLDGEGLYRTQTMGVFGDTGIYGGFAVLGTADEGIGVVGYNNSTLGFPAGYFHSDQNYNKDLPVLQTYSNGFGGQCTINAWGDLSCTGSKSAVVPVDNGSRKVALYAIEGPENWFEDAGTDQLTNGRAVVNLEAVFSQTVNTGVNYQVFLTPNGDCKGLYVTQKTPTSFAVRELGGGTSSIAFDYRILAKRKGYENIRLADKTEAFSLKNLPREHPHNGSIKAPTLGDMRKEMQKHIPSPAKLMSPAASISNKK